MEGRAGRPRFISHNPAGGLSNQAFLLFFFFTGDKQTERSSLACSLEDVCVCVCVCVCHHMERNLWVKVFQGISITHTHTHTERNTHTLLFLQYIFFSKCDGLTKETAPRRFSSRGYKEARKKVTRLSPVGLDFKQHLSKQMGHLNKSL